MEKDEEYYKEQIDQYITHAEDLNKTSHIIGDQNLMDLSEKMIKNLKSYSEDPESPQ